jgi:hypothetical protein
LTGLSRISTDRDGRFGVGGTIGPIFATAGAATMLLTLQPPPEPGQEKARRNPPGF